MKINSVQHKVTLTIDLGNYRSIEEAIEYLKNNASCPMEQKTNLFTTKIRLIKLVREYGNNVADTAHVNHNGEIEHDNGLRPARDFIECLINESRLIAYY